MPITEGARALALSYNASQFTLPEHQCEVQVVSYIYRGPINLRIWEERDPVTQKLIAFKHYLSNYQQTRTIWMDNRPHPPEEAQHTWMGFSTGKFEANILTVYTTHIKSGWVRRNGLRQTDQATMTEHFIRHGDQMTTNGVVLQNALVLEFDVGGQGLAEVDQIMAEDSWPDDVNASYVGRTGARAEVVLQQ